MKVIHRFWTAPLAAAVAFAAGACATTTPKELQEARQAYQEAESGPASQVAPADLLEAKQALQRAEQAFDEEGDEPVVIDQAYIAHRKAQIATTVAQMRQYSDELAQAQERRNEMTAQVSKELHETRQDLEEERESRIQAEAKAEGALQELKENARVTQEQRGLVVSLASGLMFNIGESEVRPPAYERLETVAKLLQSSPNRMVVVEGYTDSQGGSESNIELSRRRAESVKQFLVSQGVPAQRIRTRGYGEANPVAANDTQTGRAQNRRVEIVIEPLQTQGGGQSFGNEPVQ